MCVCVCVCACVCVCMCVYVCVCVCVMQSSSREREGRERRQTVDRLLTQQPPGRRDGGSQVERKSHKSSAGSWEY